MAKKGQVQLQLEIENDEDWDKLLQREGLIVVDIYSEWCGPCSAMQANLKKIKMEYGGENLILAIALADNISALQRFRQKSEPTWMFLSRGKVVNLMFGANAPKLMRIMMEEIQKEVASKAAPVFRVTIEVEELTQEEKVRHDKLQQAAEDAAQREIERKEQMLHERRLAVAKVVLNNTPKAGVIVVFPHARTRVVATLVELWEPAQISVASSEKPRFNETMIEELLYFADQTFSAEDIEDLTNGQALAYLVKHVQGDEFTGNIDELLLNFIYGESACPPGSPNSPAQTLKGRIEIVKEIEALPSVTKSMSQAAPSSTNALGPPVVASIAEIPVQSQVLPSQSLIRSVTEVSKSSSLARKSESRKMVEEEEEEIVVEDEFIEFQGIWAPPNDLTKGTAIKLLFPKLYDPIALPEPVPTPPHIAVAFEILKRREVLKLISEYPNEVMRYGFFTDDKPETTKLIAKTVPKFEKLRAAGGISTGKLIVQLSRKRSEAWCAFAQLGPASMSLNTEEGEEQCKTFFPEGYDVPDDDDEVKPAEEGDKTKDGMEETYVMDEEVDTNEVNAPQADAEPDGDVAEQGEAELEMDELAPPEE